VKKTRLSIGFAAMFMASGARAEVVPSLLVANPEPTGMPGWVGVVLRLTSDEGNIRAMDFGGTDPHRPEQALKGLFGEFHQRWRVEYDEVTGDAFVLPTPVSPIVNPASPASRDSFWSNSFSRPVVYSAEEDNSLNGSPLADSAVFDNGVGTAMHYTVGVQLPVQTSTLDIAYLVGRQGQTMRIKGELATNSVVHATIIDSILTFPVIPEPTGAGMVGGVGVGFCARRRADRTKRNAIAI
jgi:hypothetical protein